MGHAYGSITDTMKITKIGKQKKKTESISIHWRNTIYTVYVRSADTDYK
jgi:hypothetical protein